MSEIFKVKVKFAQHENGYSVERVTEELANGGTVEHKEFASGDIHTHKEVPMNSIAQALGIDRCYVEEY